MRLQEEGAQVTVAGLTTQPVPGKNGLEATADVGVETVSADTIPAFCRELVAAIEASQLG